MAQQTFGYQTQCPWCAQQPTTKLISTSIKQFADHVLLEDKFADGFARSGRPFQIWKKLQSDYAPRLNGR
jgi:hypothetical protein